MRVMNTLSLHQLSKEDMQKDSIFVDVEVTDNKNKVKAPTNSPMQMNLTRRNPHNKIVVNSGLKCIISTLFLHVLPVKPVNLKFL